tara:strand:+ start:3706 stop:4521 length:816 start_codon:yes stop_codon:yes gene_type:complete
MATFSFNNAHHEVFQAEGYLRLGKILSKTDLVKVQQRIDDIMMGRVRYDHMRLQWFDEETGKLCRTQGNEMATLSYRRIDDLEQDPLFLAYIQQPLFRQIAERYNGDQISVFRSMFMNKPARWEQTLPWHQDVGVGWRIDSNPITTVWTSLDDATIGNGCMQIVPGSHHHGIINDRHFLSDQEEVIYAPSEAVVNLEAEAGEAILLHNFLLHRSGSNPTTSARRAFSVTYMDARTRTCDTGRTFPIVFGNGALNPETVNGKPAELIETFYG